LTIVSGNVGIDVAAPERTLDRGRGVRVAAVGSRSDGRITLKVDVDGLAAVYGIAESRTPLRLVSINVSEAEIAIRHH